MKNQVTTPFSTSEPANYHVSNTEGNIKRVYNLVIQNRYFVQNILIQLQSNNQVFVLKIFLLEEMGRRLKNESIQPPPS